MVTSGRIEYWNRRGKSWKILCIEMGKIIATGYQKVRGDIN